MPSADNAHRPVSIKRALPPHAQGIFRGAFKAARRSHDEKDPVRREEIAHRVAWAAGKRRYRKSDRRWLPVDH